MPSPRDYPLLRTPSAVAASLALGDQAFRRFEQLDSDKPRIMRVLTSTLVYLEIAAEQPTLGTVHGKLIVTEHRETFVRVPAGLHLWAASGNGMAAISIESFELETVDVFD